jgi:hypothetical protein
MALSKKVLLNDEGGGKSRYPFAAPNESHRFVSSRL